MILSRRLFDESADTGISSDTGTAVADPPENTLSSDASESSQTDSSSDSPAGDVSPDASGAAAPVSKTLFDVFREEHGLDFSQKYKSEEDLRKGLANAAKLIGTRDRYSELGRSVAPHWDEFQKFMQMHGGPQPEQTRQPESWWQLPEWHEAWNKFLDPETGGVRENAPLEIRNAYEKRQDYIARWAHRLTTDPMGALEPLLRQHSERLLSEFDQRYERVTKQQAEMAESNSIIAENAHWLFQTGPKGEVLQDDGGQSLFTDAGLIMLDELAKQARAGVRDQRLAFENARLHTQLRLGGVNPPKPKVPSNGKHQPNTNGSPSRKKPATSDEAGLSLRERLLREAEDMPDSAF